MAEGRRRLPLQNGFFSHLSSPAIFVAGAVLLLYGPHGVTGQATCDDLWAIMEQPEGVQCFSSPGNPPAIIYQDLPEDRPAGQVFAFVPLEGITFTQFAAEGDPVDVAFDTYFSATLEGSGSISLDSKENLKDFTDYAEDGTDINTQDNVASANYKLTYENGGVEQDPIVIEKIQFFVNDANNKEPEFDKESYTTKLREDWPLNIEMQNLNVKVKDRDGDGTITLSFDDDCPMGVYDGASEITITNGDYSDGTTFVLQTKLDYEANPTVICTLTADDGVNKDTSEITINVEPGQDKPPKFGQTFYWTEVEIDASVDEALIIQPEAIEAVDQDDPPTKISYSMEDAQEGVTGIEYFAIDADSGVITLKKELDDTILDQKQLRFVLFATDEVGDEDKAFLEINLPMPLTTTQAPTTSTSTTPNPTTPGGDTTKPATISTSTTSASTTHTPSGPVFRKDTYLFQALTSMDSMGTVKATVDGQEDTEIVYSLDDILFEVDPKTGEVSKKLDAELSVTTYELTVTALANSLTSETMVKVVVQEDMDTTLSILKSLHEVSLDEEQEGIKIGEVKYLPEKETTTLCVIYQDGKDSYDDVYFTFDESKSLKLKDGVKLDREREKQLRVWVQIFNTAECSDEYLHSGPTDLLRSQSLFVIDVGDINDHAPTLDYPKEDITIAYPEDPALQKVVGPVIQLSASDEDDTDFIRYTLSGDDNFAVDAESGAVFWEGGSKNILLTSCGEEGCSFKVKAEDQDGNKSALVTCKVVSLPADNIYTMTFSDMTLTEVEAELSELSEEVSMDVRALYVTPKPLDTTKARVRDGLGETAFDLDIHVSVMKDGEIVALDTFNGELSKHDKSAVSFKDKELFDSGDSGNVAGYQIALGVTGGLMVVLLLAFVIIGFIRYRKRSEKRRGPEVPDLRRGSYSNQGYVKEDIKQNDALDGSSFTPNDSVGGFHQPPRAGGDSPPLNRSQLGVTPDSTPSGLRRISPENVPHTGQPASREPPAQFKESTQQPQKESQLYTTAVPVGSTAASGTQKQPAVEPAYTPATTPYTTSSVNQPRKRKEPPPLTAEPKKSALKGTGGTTSTDSQKPKDQQIPLDSMAPSEPTADYDSSPAKTATSSFSTLKASPPPKKKEAKVDDDNTDDDEEEKQKADVKKSNLKTAADDSNDQDQKEEKERRKSSVAFKVLVEQKIIEPQNEGPAAKKQAKEEAKAEANQAAVDLMEANKKKLEDEEEEDNSKL